jgi:hypothetical protein
MLAPIRLSASLVPRLVGKPVEGFSDRQPVISGGRVAKIA